MTIRSFSFHDKISGWRLQETSFGPVNLLVGASGVGKTKILEALRDVTGVARETTSVIGSWKIEVEDGKGSSFVWEVETEDETVGPWRQISRLVNAPTAISEGVDSFDEEPPQVVHETISRDGGTLFARRLGKLLQPENGAPYEIKASKSLLHLSDDAEIAALRDRIGRQFFEDPRPVMTGSSARATGSATDVTGVGRAVAGLIERAYLLQRDFPEDFDNLFGRFRVMFPFVEDMRIARIDELWPDAPKAWPGIRDLTLGIRERGVDEWIVGGNVSGGMIRAFALLVDVTVAPSGTVFLIDEIENSLGNNCLPEVVDLLWERAGDLQFIITTHHPYVINNIPLKHWKIVTRKGSVVVARPAESFDALRTASRFERFTRLLNLPAFEEGVA